jgi:Subtilase family.
MTNEEREKIVSEDYADLLITYSGDQNILQKYKNDTINIIDFYNAVVHVPVGRINDNTIVEMGYSVMPSLFGLASHESLEASGILRIRNVPNFNLRGQGVLIGIMDTGIDYTNPIFQNADKTTRITSIWDQTEFGEHYPFDYYYGTEYTREQINEALKNENPLSVVPTKDEIGHGTMVAGIAAGNEVPDSDFYGVAPDAELVVVKLKQAKKYIRDFFIIPEDVPCYQENDVLFALNYLVAVANRLNKPIAICAAIGTSQGAHDGKGTTSSALSMKADSVGVGVAVAGGSEGNARRHYSGKVSSDVGYDTVELQVGPSEKGFSMELWGSSPDIYSIDIQTPSGEYIPKITPILDETRFLNFIFEPTTINIDFQISESQSGEQLILMRFKKPAPGVWRFKVYYGGDMDGAFNIWLPMEGFISNDTFFTRSDPYITLLSLANARVPIAVTAYNTKDQSLYINAGRGYTTTSLVKPEIAAPGVNVMSPGPNNTFVEVTGTSAAAAHTTGVAAMMLEWGIVKGNQPFLNTLDMKVFMIRGAKRNPDVRYPNREWGYGILDVYNIFDALRLGANP